MWSVILRGVYAYIENQFEIICERTRETHRKQKEETETYTVNSQRVNTTATFGHSHAYTYAHSHSHSLTQTRRRVVVRSIHTNACNATTATDRY